MALSTDNLRAILRDMPDADLERLWVIIEADDESGHIPAENINLVLEVIEERGL